MAPTRGFACICFPLRGTGKQIKVFSSVCTGECKPPQWLAYMIRIPSWEKKQAADGDLFFMAPTRGFEPPTYRLGGGRSILLSYVGVQPAHSTAVYESCQEWRRGNCSIRVWKELCLAKRILPGYSVCEVIPMSILRVYRRMLSMGETPWRVLILCLQVCCVLLFTSAVLLLSFQESGSSAQLSMARLLQELSQLSLLLGGLLPVLLEDLLPPG